MTSPATPETSATAPAPDAAAPGADQHGGPVVHVAQLNVATLRAPLDADETADFRNALAMVNAAGESTDGFVWRLQGDDGDATSIRVSADPLEIVNLTVWSSIDPLFDFTYRSVHREFLRRRREWFVDAGRASVVWHLPAGALPTVGDAMARLDFLRSFGDSPFAFGTVPSRQAPRHPVLVVTDHPLDDLVSQRLITELNAELDQHPGTHFFSLDPTEVGVQRGAFLVAWLDGRPVGCGAIRLLDDGRAEVKRMYVHRESRGSRIGAAVLHELERRALALGAHTLVLETAEYLMEAVSLYRKVGFEPCPCWGEYANGIDNCCFAKPLTTTA